MDPLSVTASVLGLLAAAGQVTSLLVAFTKSANGAPDLAQAVLTDLQQFSSTLGHLQGILLDGATSADPGASLVLVEHVVVILTSCVLTLSELEETVNSIGTDQWGVLNRVRWTLKESAISHIYHRLQAHKSSLSLMLNILEYKSSQEAERSLSRVCGLVEELLESNREMSKRLGDLELRSSSQALARAASCGDDDISTTLETGRREFQDNLDQRRYQPVFENVLRTTRVYRRTLRSPSMTSLPDSIPHTTSWSVLTGLSLADVSNISVLALPIYPSEINNGHWYHSGQNHDNFRNCDGKSSSSSQGQDLGSIIRRGGQDFSIFTLARELDSDRGSGSTRVTTSSGAAYYEQSQNGHVPIIVAWYGWTLKNHALNVPHVFRTKGSPQKIRYLPKYDWEIYGNFRIGVEYDVHDAATILIQYLNQLPRPVIPWRMYDHFLLPLRSRPVHSLSEREIEVTHGVYLSYIHQLSRLDRNLLLYILDLLAKFGSNSHINQMTAADLALIFQRSLLSHPDRAEEGSLCQNVLAFLIENQSHFRNPPPPEHPEAIERPLPDLIKGHVDLLERGIPQ